jgi:hypothetical protein
MNKAWRSTEKTSIRCGHVPNSKCWRRSWKRGKGSTGLGVCGKALTRLTELLEAKKIDKAFAVVKGEPAAPKKPKVETPRTLNDHGIKSHSEFFEACIKVKMPEEVKIVEAYYRQMGDELEKLRKRFS